MVDNKASWKTTNKRKALEFDPNSFIDVWQDEVSKGGSLEVAAKRLGIDPKSASAFASRCKQHGVELGSFPRVRKSKYDWEALKRRAGRSPVNV